jgi:thiol-disulfide isomerase/thioredoxin
MLQNDVVLSDSLVTSTIEELHENGEDAVSLDPMSFEAAKKDYTYVFVDFYASWCSHCRQVCFDLC